MDQLLKHAAYKATTKTDGSKYIGKWERNNCPKT